MNMGWKWTPEADERLKQLLEQGMSCSQVADMLQREFHVSLSRNAVIGRAHRIERASGKKLSRAVAPKKATPGAPRAGKPVVIAPRSKPAPSMAGDTGGFRMPKVRLKYRPRKVPELKPGRVCGIVELTGCKWAVGFDQHVAGGHLFCNAELHDERYCEFHARESRASYSTDLVNKTVKQALKAHRRAA